MRVAIFDPFSGIAGDMALGALLAVGLEQEWLESLPARLGLDGVTVRVATVDRGQLSCRKVDFDIPPEPHGRHLKHIREIVQRSEAPERVKERADAAFTALTRAEAEIHGTTVEKVHLHEVGAVDAILDVMGTIWGLELLGVERVYCGTIALGDGTVKAAHGVLPVPAPATLKLLEGHPVRPGPENSGELVTPTGAALVRVLSAGRPPREYVPVRSGFGAGTKEFPDRANALRIVLADVATGGAEHTEPLVELVTDIDDMSPEYLAAVAERLREAGALDVVTSPVTMKRGRVGTRLEILATPGDAERLEAQVLRESTSIGIRRREVSRWALPREMISVSVLGYEVGVKVVRLPDGGRRAKPEFTDVQRVALATGRTAPDISRLAAEAAEGPDGVPGSHTSPRGNQIEES